ncbi:MAG: gene transfer agent family protein [Sphingomonadales bacterium]|nr:gene transfer agent family protein [Sphingomonadales bacterium]
MTVTAANPWRGEACLVVADRSHLLRPSFTALIAAEEELGPLFALVERAGAGQLRLSEMAALFWHCLTGHDRPSRDHVGEAVTALGLARASAPLRVLLTQILQGSAAPPEP